MELRHLRRNGPTYLFIAAGLVPILAIYLWLRILPIFQTFNLSLRRVSLLRPNQAPFVGLNNYRTLFDDLAFWQAMVNTLLFTLGMVLVGVGLAMALAVALHTRHKVSGWYQFIYFIPVVVPWVPVSIIWRWIYDPVYGPLNYLLSLFGIPKQAWLVDSHLALVSIIAMAAWKTVGLYAVLLLVGLKGIPGEIFEAAHVDGAHGWKLFRRITVPLLCPVLLSVVVLAIIEAFTVFTPVFIMTQGSQSAPSMAVATLVYDMYEKGFRFFKLELAAAESVVLLLLVLITTLLQFRLFRERV